MKRYLFFIFFISLIFVNANRYVSKDGDNGNGGTGWGDAWLTIGYGVDNDLVGGDTLIIGAGTYVETVTPSLSGTSSDPLNMVVLMDSADHANGYVVDTTWSVIIDGGSYCIDFNSSDPNYIKICGLWLKSATKSMVRTGSSSLGIYLDNCKLSDHADGVGEAILADLDNDTTTVTNCLFLADGLGMEEGLNVSSASAYNHYILVNNTFYGSFSTRTISNGSGSSTCNLINNLVYNISSNAAAYCILNDKSPFVYWWDYNLWYEDNLTNTWNVDNGTDDFATYKTEVQEWDVTGDGEAHAVNADPLLQNTSTTCYINDNSPAWGADSSGANIGYYQSGDSPPAGLMFMIDFDD